MGRPRKEATKVMRIPMSLVPKVEALLGKAGAVLATSRLGAGPVGTGSDVVEEARPPSRRPRREAPVASQGFESPAPASCSGDRESRPMRHVAQGAGLLVGEPAGLEGSDDRTCGGGVAPAPEQTTQARLAIARAALAAHMTPPSPGNEMLVVSSLKPDWPEDDFAEPALAYHADEAECPNCGAGNPEPGGHHNEKRCNRNPQHPGHARYRRDK